MAFPETRYGPLPSGKWERRKDLERGGIIGWWEHTGSMSIITLTKGIAHIAHKGAALSVYTPEELYSSNPNTIGKMVAKRIGIADVSDSQAFD